MKAPSYITYMLDILNDIDEFNIEEVKYRLLHEKENLNKSRENSTVRKIEFGQAHQSRSLTPR